MHIDVNIFYGLYIINAMLVNQCAFQNVYHLYNSRRVVPIFALIARFCGDK